MDKMKLQDCFVISPIGDAESETRKRSDQVFKHIIIPSVSKHNYKPIRADHISEPGIITTQVIQYIVDAPLVIADLTERNPNVFYELAIRHAIKKPFIQIIKKGEQIPFDVAATRIIHFDIQDLDSVDQAKSDIENQMQKIIKGDGEFDNTISISLELKILKESGNPEQMSFADLLSVITELRSGILSIEKRISDPTNLIPPDYFDHIYRRISRKNVSPEIYMLFEQHLSELREMIDRLRSVRKRKSKEEFEMTIMEISERMEVLYKKFEMTFMEIRHMM